MLKLEFTQLIVTGKLSLIIRMAFLTLVIGAALMGVAPVFAEPGVGITGG